MPIIIQALDFFPTSSSAKNSKSSLPPVLPAAAGVGVGTPLRHLQERGSPSVLGESTHPLSKCALRLGEIEARPWTGAKKKKNLGVPSSQPYRSWGARGEEENTRAHTSGGGSSPSARNAGRRAMAHRGTKWGDRVHEPSGSSRSWMESGSATRFGDPPLQGHQPLRVPRGARREGGRSFPRMGQHRRRLLFLER